MLKHYFYANGDKNQSAEGLDFVFKKVPEFFADEYTHIWEQKSHQADGYNRRCYWNRQKWNRYPDGQGINTGGNRQNQ